LNTRHNVLLPTGYSSSHLLLSLKKFLIGMMRMVYCITDLVHLLAEEEARAILSVEDTAQ
jgi:hypothetical protein